MTEPVLSSFRPTKGTIRGSLLPQSGNNRGLGIVGLCYAQSCRCAHRLACHISRKNWAHDQEKHSQGESNAGLN